jgi:hypothetical protein
MKFHITIKDNETGEILHDRDCNAIIAGLNDGEKSTSVVLTQCNGKDLVYCAKATQKSINSAIPKGSRLDLMLKLLNAIAEEEDKEDK